MKTLRFAPLLLILLSACSPSEHPGAAALSPADTTRPLAQAMAPVAASDTLIPAPQPMPEKETVAAPDAGKKKTELPPVKKPANDTVYHYYTDGAVSARITPWVNSKRSIWLYDPKGRRTYTFSDERSSYISTTTLSFQANGAVSKAGTHLNPGASMYMYETTTTFGPANEPLTQVKTQSPQMKLEMPVIYHWDPAQQRWVDPGAGKQQELLDDLRH